MLIGSSMSTPRLRVATALIESRVVRARVAKTRRVRSRMNFSSAYRTIDPKEHENVTLVLRQSQCDGRGSRPP